MSKLGGPEGEPEGCYGVLAWVTQASKNAKQRTTVGQSEYERDVTNVMRMCACLSDRVSPFFEFWYSVRGGGQL